MTTSNMFVANGAAAMAFKTNGARIDFGVNAIARKCGVFGSSEAEFGRDVPFGGVGVWGDGKAIGVNGRGSFEAKDGNGHPSSVGVSGEGGQAGVVGKSAIGRGGVFRSEVAQVQLVPLAYEQQEPRDRGERLPATGQAGDLLALGKGRLGAELWFCGRGHFFERGVLVNAMWYPVQLGTQVEGRQRI